MNTIKLSVPLQQDAHMSRRGGNMHVGIEFQMRNDTDRDGNLLQLLIIIQHILDERQFSSKENRVNIDRPDLTLSVVNSIGSNTNTNIKVKKL